MDEAGRKYCDLSCLTILVQNRFKNRMSNTKDVVIVETIRGQISAQDVAKISICLLHERLSPIVYPVSCERPLTIQHIDFHRANLLSLENSSLTPGMIDHQLQTFIHSSGKSIADVIILDGSNYGTRLPELLEKYVVVKGYQYKLSGNPSQGQRAVLLSKDHISKQIEYQFKLGNGKYKPGFIGELLLSECLEESMYFNAFNAYLQYSAKSNCPIIINSLEQGKESATSSLKDQGIKEELRYSAQILQKINIVLQTAQRAKVNKLVIYNLPFIFETIFDSTSFREITQNVLHPQIIQLISKYDCFFGFDIARYAYSPHALHYIGQLLNEFPSRIILSAGLACKTDLTPYAGAGYLYYKGERIQDVLAIVGQQKLKNALHHTKIKLLLWKIKKQEVKLAYFWKCNQCGNDQPEEVESFRKFGKQFCSIKCLKAYKF